MLFDEVAAKLVKTSVEVRCLKTTLLFHFNLPAIAKRVNQPPALSELFSCHHAGGFEALLGGFRFIFL